MLGFGLNVVSWRDVAGRRPVRISQLRPALQGAVRMGPAPIQQSPEDTATNPRAGPLRSLAGLLRALFGGGGGGGDSATQDADTDTSRTGTEPAQAETPGPSYQATATSDAARAETLGGSSPKPAAAVAEKPFWATAVSAAPVAQAETVAPAVQKLVEEAERARPSVTWETTAMPAVVMQPRRPPRDPRRVMVVGAGGRLGKAIVSALLESSSRFSVVAVVKSSEDVVPKGCARVLTLDVSTQAAALAQETIRLGCGSVIWCASAGPKGVPRDVDYGAVRAISESLGSGLAPESSPESNLAWLADENDCVSLVDFSTPEGPSAFRPIDDAVMGGLSSSSVRAGLGSADDNAPAVWSGNITRANNGGFVSVRADLSEAGSATGVDLSGCAGVAVTCRGDGKRYKVNLKDCDRPELVYQAVFDTSDNGKWQTVRIPFSNFVPVIRGKLAYADDGSGVYASELDTSRVVSVGLVCSKIEPGGLPCPKFKEGDFRLDLARIDAYRYSVPRFVLVSSAAVTRPFWDAKKARVYKSSADIPIVRLNETIGNLLGVKLAGEDALRISGIPYSVVRPTGLAERAPIGASVQVSQGDFATGVISAEDCARAILELLGSEDATWKTIEMNGVAEKEWSEGEFLESLGQMAIDSEQVLYPDNPDAL